jgi:polyribonucleotide nucleotidyltransferase
MDGSGSGGDRIARITGTPACIARARERLEKITLAVTGEVRVSAVAFQLLMSNRAQLTAQLQRDHEVKIDLLTAEAVAEATAASAASTSANAFPGVEGHAGEVEGAADVAKGRSGKAGKGPVCHIVGLPQQVEAAKAAILSLSKETVSKTVRLPDRVRPVVIGSKGSNVQKLQSDHGVVVDLKKEDETVAITGNAVNVAAAVAQVQALVNQHEEIEEELALARNIVMVLLGNKGERIRQLQTDSGARLDLDKPDAAAGAGAEGSPAKSNGKAPGKAKAKGGLPDGPRKLVIKGTRSQIEAARRLIDTIVRDTTAGTITISSGGDPSVLGNVVGKKGETIKKLRETYSSVRIEVERETETVEIMPNDPADPAQREMAAACAEAVRVIIDQNQKITIPMDAALGRQFFSSSGKAIRDDLQKHLALDRDRENDLLTIRGPREHLDRATEAIQEFRDSMVTDQVVICKEDEVTVLAGGPSSLLSTVGKDTGVELKLATDEEPSRILVTGQRAAVLQAVTQLRELLGGDGDGKVVVLDVDADVVGAVIGRKGVNANRIQETHNVKVENLASHSRIRIRGQDAAAVSAARVEIDAILQAATISALVPVMPGQGTALPDSLLQGIAREIGVSAVMLEGVEADQAIIKLRGPCGDVALARTRITEYLEGHAVVRMPLSLLHPAFPDPSTDPLWNIVAEQVQRNQSDKVPARGGKALQVGVEEGATGYFVRIEGSPLEVKEARALVFNYLAARFPAYFATVELPPVLKADENFSGLTKAPLAKIAQDRRSEIMLEWSLNTVRIAGETPEMTDKAAQDVESLFSRLAAKRAVVPLAGEWLIPYVIGKSGANIKALRKAHNVKVEIDNASLLVTVQGSNPEAVKQAVAALETTLANAAAQRVDKSEFEVLINDEALDNVRLLIGAKGVGIRKIQDETKTQIDVVRVGDQARKVVVKGKADAIQAAVIRIRKILYPNVGDNDAEGHVPCSVSAPLPVNPEARQPALATKQLNSKERRRRAREGLEKKRPEPAPEPTPEQEPPLPPRVPRVVADPALTMLQDPALLGDSALLKDPAVMSLGMGAPIVPPPVSGPPPGLDWLSMGEVPPDDDDLAYQVTFGHHVEHVLEAVATPPPDSPEGIPVPDHYTNGHVHGQDNEQLVQRPDGGGANDLDEEEKVHPEEEDDEDEFEDCEEDWVPDNDASTPASPTNLQVTPLSQSAVPNIRSSPVSNGSNGRNTSPHGDTLTQPWSNGMALGRPSWPLEGTSSMPMQTKPTNGTGPAVEEKAEPSSLGPEAPQDDSEDSLLALLMGA